MTIKERKLCIIITSKDRKCRGFIIERGNDVRGSRTGKILWKNGSS